MAGYVKLFGSILQSSIWDLPAEERVVWVTMMALADRDGVIEASLPGLAHEARISREVAERALAIFLAPDPDSRTKDFDGRRIEVVDGGWRLLNHEKYREMESADHRRKRNAERQQRHRDRQRAREGGVTPPVTLRNALLQNVTGSDPDPDQIKEREHRNVSPEPEPEPKSAERGSWQWPAYGWYTRFSARWFDVKGRMYGRGSDRDSKATGELSEMLAGYPEEELRAIQNLAPRMIELYLAENGQVAEAEHPWSWFVGRFPGLTVKAGNGKKKMGDMDLSDYPETEDATGA
jgi:hypothetical protein